MQAPNIRLQLLSEQAVLIHFAEDIAISNIAIIQQAKLRIEAVLGAAFIDSISAYTSLLVQFDPLLVNPAAIADLLLPLLTDKLRCEPTAAKAITLPVYYHPDCGLDLISLAEQLNMPWQRIAELHQEQSYQVFALGFSPGFAFMGEVPRALQVPRLSQPRRHVAAGSVAIAEKQTAIYPTASPGGWHILGRCPQALFNRQATPPNVLSVGQTVSFKAIGREEFLYLGGKLDD